MRNDITRVAMAATEPEMVQNRVFETDLGIFSKNHQITSRLVRSMRNDITRVAMVATEPEIVQNEVFWGPQEGGKIIVLEWPFAVPAYMLVPWLWELKATRGELSTDLFSGAIQKTVSPESGRDLFFDFRTGGGKAIY